MINMPNAIIAMPKNPSGIALSPPANTTKKKMNARNMTQSRDMRFAATIAQSK
jgi:hypothetical protein